MKPPKKVKITKIGEDSVNVENEKGYGIIFYFSELAENISSKLGKVFKSGDSVEVTRDKNGIKFKK
jgi:hypothetical protein